MAKPAPINYGTWYVNQDGSLTPLADKTIGRVTFTNDFAGDWARDAPITSPDSPGSIISDLELGE